MAPKDNDKPIPGESQAAQQEKKQLQDAAANVTKAAAKLHEKLGERLGGMPLNRFITKDELRAMKEEVDGVDDLFAKEERDLLRDAEVRIMKYDPNGLLTDVTDRVRPEHLRPEDIADVRVEPGLTIPRNADGKLDQEGALDLLTKLLSGGRRRAYSTSFDDRLAQLQLKEMENVINEADKTLEHWKK